MNRAQQIEQLRAGAFDLCIIGAGASGAGSALDASLRGLKVALLDQTDFAAETSSRSTKLIHGGVRYLEQAIKKLDFPQLRQVRHGLEERHTVLQNAPHLAHPLCLITPVFAWWQGLYYAVGLTLYDFFASKKDNLPRSKWISKRELLRRLPGLHTRVHSAVMYFDGQLDDARYCLALVQTACENGASVANHLKVVDFQKDTEGQLQKVQVVDQLSGEAFSIKARRFLNCTGPFSDSIRRLANPALPLRLRPSKGVHLLLPGNLLGDRDALLIPETRDGRVVFAIPFQGSLLLGTTDTDYPDPAREALLLESEIDYLLETLQPYVSTRLDRSMVRAGFGGLRPLLLPPPEDDADRTATQTLLRDHEVEHDPVSGLWSLMGGKWTTYRLMARDAVDAVSHDLGHFQPSATENCLLAGAEGFSENGWQVLQQRSGLPESVCRHLNRQYGNRAGLLLDLAALEPALSQPLHPAFPFIGAEVVYAAQAEMACTLRDVLARRFRLEILDWQAAYTVAPVVAGLLGKTLLWTTDQQSEALKTYLSMLDSFRVAAGVKPESKS